MAVLRILRKDRLRAEGFVDAKDIRVELKDCPVKLVLCQVLLLG
jgi:hypothetical protein